MNPHVQLVRAVRRSWRMACIVVHILVGALAAQLLPVGPHAPLPRVSMQRAQRGVVRWWIRKLCRLLQVQVRWHGLLPERTTLLVTNHVSWLDIPALLSVVDADFVSKSEVLRWPMIGTMAARAGTIFLARGGQHAASVTADQMTWRLVQQRSVILFPEGTTSDGRGVRPFHARLYQAAIRAHTRVQAVAIRYPELDGPQGVAPFIDNDELLSHLWRLLGQRRVVAELHFCDPIVPTSDRRGLANRTRRQICTRLGLEVQAVQTLSGRSRHSHRHGTQ